MKYGIVVIPSDYDTEHYLRGEFEGVCGFTSISSDGKVIGKTNEDVFIIVLPHQDQTTATRLFRASEMPNTVTGDNSLSDSIYSLVFENGQGFFYEERQWKRNTMRGMVDIMAAHCAEARDIFVQGSHLMYNSVNGNPIAEMLTTNSTEYYARLQREAFRRALRCDEKSDPRSVTVQGNVCRLVAAIEAYPDIVRKENISHREHLVKGRKLAVA
ncbi:MAG: hypothetical protein KGH62_03195 [Candidatus Micrarchaeota archaeon]|nr:hypothetical protein [Candidatus Micrarchaeota archaeon]